jgi:hypothetical protein
MRPLVSLLAAGLALSLTGCTPDAVPEAPETRSASE